MASASIGPCASTSSAPPRPGRTPAAPARGTSWSGGCCSIAGPACLQSCASDPTHERLARRRRDRDHPSPPRPLGRPRAVGLGFALRAGRGACEARASASAGRHRHAATDPGATRRRGHVRASLRGRRVRVGTALRAGRADGDGAAGRPLLDAGVRLSRRGRPHARRTRATPGPATSSSSSGRTPTSSSARRRSTTRSRRRRSRGHLSADEAKAASDRAGAKRLLLTHRPDERARSAGLELASDGLELTFVELSRRFVGALRLARPPALDADDRQRHEEGAEDQERDRKHQPVRAESRARPLVRLSGCRLAGAPEVERRALALAHGARGPPLPPRGTQNRRATASTRPNRRPAATC